MKVRVARSAGFCMGVRKAMDSVLDAAHGSRLTYTIGPLIHNPQALKMLESRNIYATDDINKSLAGKTVVTRAHGIPVDKRKQLQEIGARIVDATCPKVSLSESIVKKYYAKGYTIVIVGDRGHAEIDALLSYTDYTGIVIENIDEARSLPPIEKVCVVAQTTFNRIYYHEISDEIRKHARVCHVADTVCVSTDRRQADVRKLAEVTDATVVVGGRSSANTKRLAEISRKLGQPTFLIEDPSELDLEKLSQYGEIGVTAGASTPNWVIKQVVDTIVRYTPEAHRSFLGLIMTLAFFAIEGNFIICAAAAALTCAMCRFMNIPLYPLVPLMTFFYLFPMHTVNKYLELNWRQISSAKQADQLRRYWKVFLTIGFVSFLISLAIAWFVGMVTFILVTVSYLLSGLYSVHVIPVTWDIRFKSLRDVPGSKDVVIAVGWTFAVVILPFITLSIVPDFLILPGIAYVFIMILSRTSLLAIGGIESDRLIGLETIPAFIGRRNTLRLLYTTNTALVVTIIILSALKLIGINALVMIVPVLYMIVCIKLLSRTGRFFTLYHQMMLDADFFLTCLLALLFL